MAEFLLPRSLEPPSSRVRQWMGCRGWRRGGESVFAGGRASVGEDERVLEVDGAMAAAV